jgi:hypothetical protein
MGTGGSRVEIQSVFVLSLGWNPNAAECRWLDLRRRFRHSKWNLKSNAFRNAQSYSLAFTHGDRNAFPVTNPISYPRCDAIADSAAFADPNTELPPFAHSRHGIHVRSFRGGALRS